ncbi:MAG: hypothetical protein KF752_02245 [Pirellulaceae bacterium]|nr:hypothetical protein [Pirellulaceae bacterium]
MRKLLTAALLVVVSGCGSNQAITEVSGKVVKGGKPLEYVHVEFLPDPEKGLSGPLSFADTAADGTFTLQLYGDKQQSGALVGWHRVTLQDFKALNSRDNPMPPRFGATFGFAASTPIAIEVRPGMESVTIDLNDYPK